MPDIKILFSFISEDFESTIAKYHQSNVLINQRRGEIQLTYQKFTVVMI